MESSPLIDLDVIQMFNKKFEDKYPNIRKPVIVNGLREIKPYVSVEKIMYKEEETLDIEEPVLPENA